MRAGSMRVPKGCAICCLVVCIVVFGSQMALSQSGSASSQSPSLSAPSAFCRRPYCGDPRVEAMTRLENELSEAEWQQLLWLTAGLSAGEISMVDTIAAELYEAEQQDKSLPPSWRPPVCQSAEMRANLAGEAVIAFHVRASHEPPDFYPTPGEIRALSAMRLNCPGDEIMRGDVAALARRRISWDEYRRQSRRRMAEFERENRDDMARIDAEIARMKREEAQGTASRQQAQRASTQQAAAQQAQGCRQLARIVMVQTTPIDPAKAQAVSRCPQLAQYLAIRNVIRETNEELRATEPSAPQSWHCEHAWGGGVDCDSR
jgi:hypothetical protein